ncbi:MAG: ArsR family transcriptional regulator [Pseudomonadota bacterium]
MSESPSGWIKKFAYLSRMAGHEIEGLRPGQIAAATGFAPATVTRDLRAMREAGIVENIPGMDDRWRLGPKIVQIALAHMTALDRASTKLAEVTQRFSREPR